MIDIPIAIALSLLVVFIVCFILWKIFSVIYKDYLHELILYTYKRFKYRNQKIFFKVVREDNLQSIFEPSLTYKIDEWVHDFKNPEPRIHADISVGNGIMVFEAKEYAVRFYSDVFHGGQLQIFTCEIDKILPLPIKLLGKLTKGKILTNKVKLLQNVTKELNKEN